MKLALISPMESVKLRAGRHGVFSTASALTIPTLERPQMATHQDSTPSKSCSKCGETKPLTAFYRHPHCRFGRAAQCKACETAQSKAADKRRADPPAAGVMLGPTQFKRCTTCNVEKLPTEFANCRRYKSGLTSECRDCKLGRQNDFRAKNLEQCRVRDRGYNISNRAGRKASSYKWHKANPESGRRSRRRAYRKFADTRRAYSRRWACENPNRCWANLFNRRSRKKAGGCNVPAKELLRVRFVDSLGICSYCNGGGQIQIDHIEPLTKGGLHELENFAAACGACNRDKRNTPLLIWLARRAQERQRALAA